MFCRFLCTQQSARGILICERRLSLRQQGGPAQRTCYLSEVIICVVTASARLPNKTNGAQSFRARSSLGSVFWHQGGGSWKNIFCWRIKKKQNDHHGEFKVPSLLFVAFTECVAFLLFGKVLVLNLFMCVIVLQQLLTLRIAWRPLTESGNVAERSAFHIEDAHKFEWLFRWHHCVHFLIFMSQEAWEMRQRCPSHILPFCAFLLLPFDIRARSLFWKQTKMAPRVVFIFVLTNSAHQSKSGRCLLLVTDSTKTTAISGKIWVNASCFRWKPLWAHLSGALGPK